MLAHKTRDVAILAVLVPARAWVAAFVLCLGVRADTVFRGCDVGRDCRGISELQGKDKEPQHLQQFDTQLSAHALERKIALTRK